MKSAALAVFLFAASAFAIDCNAPVVDNANVLQGKIPQIQSALASLSAKGADPRVVTDDLPITPDIYVNDIKNHCPSWQSASGGVKNNLVVFVAFPKHRKVGLFIGKEYENVIHADVIRTQFMAPGFRDGDFARGMIAGINQAAVQIEGFQTAAMHPNQTVVNKQATDFSGFWKFLDALLAIGVIVGLIVLLMYLLRRRSARISAQQNAIHMRNQAASAVAGTNLSEEFARLSNQETFNPDTDGLTKDQYDEIAARYKELWQGAMVRRSAVGVGSTQSSTTKAKHHSHTYPSSWDYSTPTPTAAPPTPSTSPAPAPQTSSVNNTTIINESRSSYSDPAYIPVPVVVEEPVVVDEESHRHRDSNWSDDSSSSSSSSSESSWSESSSSSSFDSGSSSWSDSSSSSDFGSSDSGFGGGSSDF